MRVDLERIATPLSPLRPAAPLRRTLVLAVAAIGALTFCLALYLPATLTTPFFTKGEPREGLVVRQMVERHEWILPVRQSESGRTIASKPPFFHWLAALCATATGQTSEAAIRLPSVLLGTAAVTAVVGLGSTALSVEAAVIGATILATSFEWVRAVSTARVDGVLTACMTIGLLLLYRGFLRGGLSVWAAVAAYLCFACAALTKGPVGFVLPGLVLGVALLTTGELRTLGRYRPLLGTVIIVLVVGGWYAAAIGTGGDAFVQKQLLKENVFRFLGGSTMHSGHAHPVYYYLPVLAAGFLPWTPFLVAALVAIGRDRKARQDRQVRFLLVWFLVVLGFYSLASAKRSVYLLALYPAGALLTGWWWHALIRGTSPPRWLTGRSARTLAWMAAALACVALLLVLGEVTGNAPIEWMTALLHERDRANFSVVRSLLTAHRVPVIALLAIVTVALMAAARDLARQRWLQVFAAVAGAAVTIWVLVFDVVQPDLARARTLKPFMEHAARTTGGPLTFDRSTFDFGAAFYAPDGVQHTSDNPGEEPGSGYVLIWDTELARLGPRERGRLEVVDVSRGTDPHGNRHLVLARRHAAGQ